MNHHGSSSSLKRIGWLALATVLILISFIRASGTPQETAATGTTLKVTTQVVNVYAVVKDKKGHMIPGLNQNDFELTENDAPQTIKYFSRETQTPLSLGIMVDTSPSQGRVLTT